MAWYRSLCFGFVCGCLCVFVLIEKPLRPFRKAWTLSIPPQLILVLGGDIDRERVGVRLAREMSLPLVVSGGSNPEHANWLIEQSGIPINSVKLDYRARDTLSNFTSLVDDLAVDGIRHALLVTSEDHLLRSMAVGNLVAGSRGIRLSSVSVSCNKKCINEGLDKLIMDWLRALIWVLTGEDLKILLETRWVELFSRFR